MNLDALYDDLSELLRGWKRGGPFGTGRGVFLKWDYDGNMYVRAWRHRCGETELRDENSKVGFETLKPRVLRMLEELE